MITSNLTPYTYKGIKGILLDSNLPLVEGIKPIEEYGNIGFYSLESLNENGMLNKIDVNMLEYTNEDGYFQDILSSEIVLTECTNPENEHFLVYGWWGKDWAEDDLFSRELLTSTNSYYHWQSKRTEFIAECKKNKLEESTAREEWNEITKPFSGLNHFSEPATFESVWTEIVNC